MIQPVTAAEIPEIQELFTDAWNLLKKYYNIMQNDSDDDWNMLVEEYKELCMKGSGPVEQKLAEGLAVAVLKTIEVGSKE